MKKIISFLLFFNLIFIQNTFAKEEKTIFGFSLEFPSSKYVVLKEQNELTIKEFLKQKQINYEGRIPFTVLIARDGKVVVKYVGVKNKNYLRNKIVRELYL